MRFLSVALASISAIATVPSAQAWGGTAHALIDRAAIQALPTDGPIFLKKYEDYIAASASMPDTWRGNSENFSKMAEDPNHGWFREQFSFLPSIPRSRHEFMLELFKHHQKIKHSDPAAAARTNIRWTGTLPYAAIEAYDRLVVCMRFVRAAEKSGTDASVHEQNCAFDVARLGHYIGDGAQPLHDSVHADGWLGDNPHGYTRERSIHGRFESQFVDAMKLTLADIAPLMASPARRQGDMFDAILAFLDQAGDMVEHVYTLEKRDGFQKANDPDIRALIKERTAAGASMVRDMLLRAWEESAQPPATVAPSPLDFDNPRFNPETGSAPD